MTDPNPNAGNIARSALRTAAPAILIVVLAGVGVGAWWLTRDRSGSPADGPVAATSSNNATAQSADRGNLLLASARTALNERRLLAPAGDNAVEYYLQAREVEATYAAARLALLDLIAPAVSAVEGSIAAGDLLEAHRQFELLRRMGASELSLGPLNKQLEEARLSIERAEQLAAEAAASPPVAVSSPAPPEATAMQSSAPTPPSAEVSSQPAAEPAPVDPAVPVSASTASTSAPAASAPAPVAAPVADPVPASGAPVAAAADASTATLRIQEPRQLLDVRPAYPASAFQRRIEGWVELELDIGSDGAVQDVKVVRSEPTRVFDREAIRAAQRWRFEPRRENGVAVATRVRKTVSFKLGTR